MSRSEPPAPRIAMIHALAESVGPAQAAFAEHWPQARAFDLLDTSLATDLADAGGTLDAGMIERFQLLADYAARPPSAVSETCGILFTCSAFGDAIDAVRRHLTIPVLRPNEAAFRQALASGGKIGLVVTFAPSAVSLVRELEAMAAQAGRVVTARPLIVEDALAALKAGDGAERDRLVGSAAADLADCDVVVLGQFSLARAADMVANRLPCPVLTTPRAAVESLRHLVALRSHEPRLDGQDQGPRASVRRSHGHPAPARRRR